MRKKSKCGSGTSCGNKVSFWKKSGLYGYWKYKYLSLMFIPVVVFYIIFCYVPMYGVIIAFKDYNFAKGIIGSSWIGFENFERMFHSESFVQVFTNTLLISLYKLITGFPAPIIFALLLNELWNRKFKKVVQTISYLPYFLSWVVLGGMFMQLLSPSSGPINAVLKSMGIQPIFFLADVKWFRSVLVVTSLWKGVGWGSIIYLAALTGIDPELYEAAIMDGAGKWKQVLHITIPSLIPVMTIMFIFAVGGVINDDFDQIFNLYNEAVYSVGDVISTYNYRVGLISNEYGYSTAVGLFKNIIAIVLLAAANYITKRFSEYGIW
ncbi:ABC transporter permease [Ructibacterium gallinarum]|nr:ABC transporter permease subunit [Ructibacterium gallinarum]